MIRFLCKTQSFISLSFSFSWNVIKLCTHQIYTSINVQFCCTQLRQIQLHFLAMLFIYKWKSDAPWWPYQHMNHCIVPGWTIRYISITPPAPLPRRSAKYSKLWFIHSARTSQDWSFGTTSWRGGIRFYDTQQNHQ